MHSSTSLEPSFMVDVSKNVWACHSQSCIHARHGATGGNILDLVCLMEGCSLRSAGLLIQSWSQPINTQNATASRQVGPCGSQGVTANPKLAFRLKPIQFHHPYLKRRSVEPLVAERFGIGFYTGAGSMHGRVVISVLINEAFWSRMLAAPSTIRRRRIVSRPGFEKVSNCITYTAAAGCRSFWSKASSIH